MKLNIKIIISLLLLFRYIPHLVSFFIHPIIIEDTRFWLRCYGLKINVFLGYIYFLTFFPEFRNVVYKRCYVTFLHEMFAPKLNSLYITTSKKNIGKGLFIHHGFSTIIAAKSIGDYCIINQQVTIGYTSKGNPVIGNNVKIFVGAIVLGDINIGDFATIGGGAIVVDNVPSHSTVVSPKASVIKK